MPGGVAGVRQMVADFHRRGVRVLFPIMLWDQGTRDAGVPNWEATARLFAEVGADGLNGDTMKGVPRAFREASDRAGHPLVLEPESGLDSDEMVAWNNMTWGYWTYTEIPTVSRFKWLEPRHMVNICRRWARDKTDDLQHAFFNGIGYESWENIWGIWNQIPDRDAEALRRISKIERKFADGFDQPGVGAAHAGRASWHLRQQVSRGRAHVVDLRQPQRIRCRRAGRSRYPPKGCALLRSVERRGTEARTARRPGRPELSRWKRTATERCWHRHPPVPDLDRFLAEMKALAKTPLAELFAGRGVFCRSNWCRSRRSRIRRPRRPGA